MDNPIYKLIERIKEINEILAHCADTDLSFDESYKLAQFYYDYLNTNSIIDDVEKLSYENQGLLKELAAALKDESAKLIDNLEIIKDVDFIKIAEKHVADYFRIVQKLADEYTPFYKEYKNIERRLDYLDPSSEDYKETEKEYENAKRVQDEKQNEVKSSYEERDREVKRSAHLYDLNYSMLLFIATKLNRIAGSILIDLESLEKETGI